MLVDVTGSIIDFVTVVSGSTIRVFKQYELPIVVAENIFQDYSFEIEYYNVDKENNLTQVNVRVQNWPVLVKVNDYYKDIMNTRDMFYSGPNTLTEFNDEGWYSGNVVNIKANCTDCGDKVIVKNHVHEEREVLVTAGMHEYQWGFDGGSIQQSSNLIHMKHNGQVDQIVNLPQASWTEVCFRVAVPILGVKFIDYLELSRLGLSLNERYRPILNFIHIVQGIQLGTLEQRSSRMHSHRGHSRADYASGLRPPARVVLPARRHLHLCHKY